MNTHRSLSGQRLLLIDNRQEYLLSHRMPIIAAACASGMDVTTAVISQPRNAIPTTTPVSPILVAPEGRQRLLRREWLIFSNLRKLFRTSDADIVHLITIRVIFIGLLALLPIRNRKSRVICSVTGLGYIFTDTKFITRAVARIVGGTIGWAAGRLNAQLIFQNSVDRALFVQRNWVGRDRSYLVEGSGVDTDSFVATPLPENKVILFCARYLVHKGIREFIEAAEMAKRSRPEIRFALCGGVDPDNPASIAKDELTRAVGGGWVEDWGYRSDMKQVYTECSFLVLPSYREGMPKVVLEAAASGRPAIVTDAPGCSQSVVPDETGLIVPVGDSKALADAMLRLVGDDEKLILMAGAARASAEQRFSAKRIGEAVMEVYTA